MMRWRESSPLPETATTSAITTDADENSNNLNHNSSNALNHNTGSSDDNYDESEDNNESSSSIHCTEPQSPEGRAAAVSSLQSLSSLEDNNNNNSSSSKINHPAGDEIKHTTTRSNTDTDTATQTPPPSTADDIDDGGGGGRGGSNRNLDQMNKNKNNNNTKIRLQDNDDEEYEDEDEDDDEGLDHAEEDDDDEHRIPWKPQNVQSTCEFTHTILDYSTKRESGCKKAEYSDITQDHLGNRWRLIIYVNGNGRASNHHLSLFLQVADAEDLPFGWKKSVSYVLTLEHPSKNPNLSYAKRNPDKMFKLCPKAIDWGWSQFITSDRIQQDGFVKNDTLVVRAHVTVKSSSVSIDDEDAELYLKCAVEEGDATSVQLCLDQGASVNCQFKDDLYTPLHTACSSGTNAGCMEVLNLLLEKGADGNACNKWKETPLLIAANNGHKSAVEALLQHGADPSLCSEAGWSALTFAAHKGYDDIVALLLRAGAPVDCPVTEDASTPLHKACAGSKPGHLAAVQLLLDAGADVHVLNKWRETPLLTAANHGQDGAVKALLAAGADPCKCTDTGWSPLSIAAYKGHDEVVRLLLEDGAPTEEEDPTLSALLQAATKGLPETVELLLQHGADHTVTTKKGDTALSILVEQNLIDAAVDMVTEYNASIPRCSRDRKKVQRARLLINLRMKQMEREEKSELGGSTDDDEDSDEDPSTRANLAQHEIMESNGMDISATTANSSARSKKKKKKSNNNNSNIDSTMTAEEKAKAAEEALLLELEKEDAIAKKEEAKANSKKAKNRKKKERERQQKLKEEKERREREEREAQERERIRKEEEEKRRKEREERERAEREREMKEMIKFEKAMAEKRKQRAEREKHERTQKQRGSGSVSPPGSKTTSSAVSDKQRNKQQKPPKRAATDPTPNRKIVSPRGTTKPSVPLAGNRRWETTAKAKASLQTDIAANTTSSPKSIDQLRTEQPVVFNSGDSTRSTFSTSHLSHTDSGDAASNHSMEKTSPVNIQQPVTKTVQINGVHPVAQMSLPHNNNNLEHPAVTLFRREKVLEMLQKCYEIAGQLPKIAIRRVLYRWIVRAAHGTSPFTDSIIPSWIDSEQLTIFFQRQLIAENRRVSGVGLGSPHMESLREAGSLMAIICQNLAKQVAEYKQRIDDQLPPDWDDVALGMTANDGTLNGMGSIVTLSWANRAQTFLSSTVFATLRNRHVGPRNKFLAAAFVAKLWYETTQLVVDDAGSDFWLPPLTKAVLAREMGVSGELWSDPFSALDTNVFWGRLETVDKPFGGQKPFSKDERGTEEVMVRHGGSVSVCLPVDTMVAAQYVQRMVDILDAASPSNVPVSFSVFLSSECLHDFSGIPSINELQLLDPRLDGSQRSYITCFESLYPGQYGFCDGYDTSSVKACLSPSVFVVLQNNAGKAQYPLMNEARTRITASLIFNPDEDKFRNSPDFPNNFKDTHDIPVSVSTGFLDALDPVSPDPQRVVRSDFGAIGGNAIAAFSPVNDTHSRNTRRGRLFDLVDDVDEENISDDIMSGMLNNLDMDLFQNTAIGSDNVDIEAISLMGISGPTTRSFSNAGNPSAGRL